MMKTSKKMKMCKVQMNESAKIISYHQYVMGKGVRDIDEIKSKFKVI